MSIADSQIDKNIASLLEVTEALLRGEFDQDATVIDAEGLLKQLAQKINTMVVNLKSVELPLSSAGEQAPSVASNAQNVVELMKKTAGSVLDKADKLSDLAESLEADLRGVVAAESEVGRQVQEKIDTMKEDIFDIIATQTFQDVARQKMEVIIKDLNQMRNWLIEALVVLNIRHNASAENVEKKTALLRDVTGPATSESEKQDLVDDLLAEFGF